MKKKHPPTVSHHAYLVEKLRKDSAFAEAYLRLAIEEADSEDGQWLLQKTLRLLAEARGVAKVAKAAKMPRESLYRALSAKGNPRLSTLQAVTKALGLRLTVAQM